MKEKQSCNINKFCLDFKANPNSVVSSSFLIEEHDDSNLARLGTDPKHIALLQHHPKSPPSVSANHICISRQNEE